jgi:hypothetical protein
MGILFDLKKVPGPTLDIDNANNFKSLFMAFNTGTYTGYFSMIMLDYCIFEVIPVPVIIKLHDFCWVQVRIRSRIHSLKFRIQQKVSDICVFGSGSTTLNLDMYGI